MLFNPPSPPVCIYEHKWRDFVISKYAHRFSICKNCLTIKFGAFLNWKILEILNQLLVINNSKSTRNSYYKPKKYRTWLIWMKLTHAWSNACRYCADYFGFDVGKKIWEQFDEKISIKIVNSTIINKLFGMSCSTIVLQWAVISWTFFIGMIKLSKESFIVNQMATSLINRHTSTLDTSRKSILIDLRSRNMQH